MRERKQKKNPIFIFKSVLVRLRESVCLWECANTGCDWEVKRGFEKASKKSYKHAMPCQNYIAWNGKNMKADEVFTLLQIVAAAQKSNESALLEKREKVMLELDKLKR